jgi:hypothetical protein
MNNRFLDQAGIYAADVQVAYARNGALGWLVAAGWVAVPYAVQTVFHPSDAVKALAVLQGLPKPQFFTAQQLGVGFIEAIFALAVLAAALLVGTILFYRRAQLEVGGPVAQPALWPLAAFTAGILGNAAWLVGTGYFDIGGCIVGLSSAALTIGGEVLCEQLGRDFVFGSAQGQHP